MRNSARAATKSSGAVRTIANCATLKGSCRVRDSCTFSGLRVDAARTRRRASSGDAASEASHGVRKTWTHGKTATACTADSCC
eukprot:6172453-Pleurochrysis_carterae.AAC.2